MRNYDKLSLDLATIQKTVRELQDELREQNVRTTRLENKVDVLPIREEKANHRGSFALGFSTIYTYHWEGPSQRDVRKIQEFLKDSGLKRSLCIEDLSYQFEFGDNRYYDYKKVADDVEKK